jgi:hypothetical protein
MGYVIYATGDSHSSHKSRRAANQHTASANDCPISIR